MSGSLGLNVFRGEPFSNLTLTRLVNKYPYLPNRLGQMKIFRPNPLLTTAAAVDRLQGILNLIQTSPRGAPPAIRQEEKRNATYFTIPRLAQKATIRADEMQNVRSYDEPMQLMTLQDLVARKLMGPTGLTKQIEYTWENHRLGAVTGVLLDADGTTVIVNYFAAFNVAQPAAINFDLKQALTADQTDGSLRSVISATVRSMKRSAQGGFVEGQSYIVALCGDNFWDALVNHPDVVESVKYSVLAADLRKDKAFGEMQFGGVTWINYRGSDDATTIGISTNRCQFFIAEGDGIFDVHYAPGETFQDVNRPGLPMYVYNLPDPSGKNAFQEFEVDSFPLHVCNRPETLRTGLLALGD
jgi:hypothetical protein